MGDPARSHEHSADPGAGADADSGAADYESTAVSRSEYIAAVVHLYRGELSRATSWRMRLDNTTNWAVITTAGILSLSFRERDSSHVLLLMGMLLVSVFWAFESRRYRFADIWYSRVRKIEENFYGPILRRDPVSREREWGALVAADLFHPRFKISRTEALRTRLIRNYWAIYLVLLLSWLVKLSIHPMRARDWGDIFDGMAIGPASPWITVGVLGAFLLFLLYLVLGTPTTNPDEADHWKISP